VSLLLRAVPDEVLHAQRAVTAAHLRAFVSAAHRVLAAGLRRGEAAIRTEAPALWALDIVTLVARRSDLTFVDEFCFLCQIETD
jgi:hypothetical protein